MATTQPDANNTPVTVTGVVVNAVTGSPIPRALVQLGGRAMLTDREGKFEFEQYARSGGMLDVKKPGYYSLPYMANRGGKFVTENQLSQPMQLRLYPEAVLSGTVTTADGEPLQGVMLNARRSVFSGVSHQWISSIPVVTNSRGEFRIPVAPGDYRLESMYGHRGTADADVIMPEVIPGDTSTNALDVIHAHSGEELHFTLHPNTGPTYTVPVRFDSSGSGSIVTRVRMADGTTFQADFLHEAGGNIYKLRLPGGAYTLIAMKYSQDGLEIALAKVTIAGHDVPEVVMQFSPVPSMPIEMQVDQPDTDNTVPSSPMSLGLTLQNTELAMDEGMYAIYPTRQKDGTVVFRAPPGSYKLATQYSGQWYVKAATCGGHDLLRQDLMIAQGAGGLPIELTVSNQTGTLEGTARVNGQPRDAWVYLLPTMPSATPVVSVRGYHSTAAIGSYHANLAPGTYQAVAFEEEHPANYSDPASLAPYASHVRTVEIHAGEKTALDLDAVAEAEIQP